MGSVWSLVGTSPRYRTSKINHLIRSADPTEATELSRLARRSKAHWGYSKEFMDACREEMAIESIEIAAGDIEFVVAETDGHIAGFYSLSQLSPSTFSLEALYIDPAHFGRGLGRVLLDHALTTTRDGGGKHLQVQSDPNATGFYEAAGFRRTGEQESGSIPGRFLPMLEYDVSNICNV